MSNNNNFSDVCIVVDTSWIMKKYYYALINTKIEDKNGEQKPIGHIIGVVKTLKNLCNKFHPEKIIFAEDRKNCIKDQYGFYKANRVRMEYDIYKDLGFIEKYVLTYFKDMVRFVYCNCVEADWVMYSIAKKREKNDKKTMIYTADNDLYQVLNEKRKVIIYHGRKYDETVGVDRDYFVNILNYGTDPNIIKKYHNVRPDKLPLYRSWVGDKSDNIPGIKYIPKELVAFIVNNIEYADLEVQGEEYFYNKVIELIKKYTEEKSRDFNRWIEEIEKFKEQFVENYYLSRLYELEDEYIKSIKKEEIKIEEEDFQSLNNRIIKYL